MIAIQEIGIPEAIQETIKKAVEQYKNLCTGTYVKKDGTVSLALYFYENLTDNEAKTIVNNFVKDHFQ
jgi:hypothetical protein